MKIDKSRKSPNHFRGRRGWKADMICNHIAEGYYNGTISWLCNPNSGVSAHFVVGRDGRIAQVLDLKNGSWAQGTSTDANSRIFYGKATNRLVKTRKTNANFYVVSIEHEGFTGNPMPEAQYQATLWLHKHIISEVKRLYKIDIPITKEHIVGHNEITPITRPRCPGTGFPWTRLMNDLQKDDDLVIAQKLVRKYLKCLKNTTLYSNAGYGGAVTSILKKGTIVYCEKIHTARGVYIALQNPDTKEYLLPSAWTNSFDNFEIVNYTPKPKEDIPKEETPKEETPKEETPKEETPKEETPKEETPKEDDLGEVIETDVDGDSGDEKHPETEKENLNDGVYMFVFNIINSIIKRILNFFKSI